MSGLYLIAVVLLWSWLTWRLIRWGWCLTNRAAENDWARTALLVSLVMAWLTVSFWCGGGRIYYYDWKVRQMCAVDGGVKVYGTVGLLAEKFDRFGVVKMKVDVNGDRIVGDEYVITYESTLIRITNPKVWRDQFRVYSKESHKLIGESIVYSRFGGDFIGPWHPSSFGCPEDSGNASLLRKLFVISK